MTVILASFGLYGLQLASNCFYRSVLVKLTLAMDQNKQIHGQGCSIVYNTAQLHRECTRTSCSIYTSPNSFPRRCSLLILTTATLVWVLSSYGTYLGHWGDNVCIVEYKDFLSKGVILHIPIRNGSAFYDKCILLGFSKFQLYQERI